jgi:hypothetical protein
MKFPILHSPSTYSAIITFNVFHFPVKFRAIPINTDLKAFDGAVDVYMLDPKRYIMRRWLSRQVSIFLISDRMPLAIAH